MQDVSVVIVAAGSGARMGSVDKQLLPLGNLPVLLHSVALFEACQEVLEIVIVTRDDLIDKITTLCTPYHKVTKVVMGGATRQASVLAGVNSCQGKKLVAIHDAARPLLQMEDAARVFQDARKTRASTLGVAVKDTIKRVDGDGVIVDTPDRASLYLIQTPQVFDKDLYLSAISTANEENKDYTDDCQLIEALGVPVHITQGSYQNLKITTPEDLILAQSLWEASL